MPAEVMLDYPRPGAAIARLARGLLAAVGVLLVAAGALVAMPLVFTLAAAAVTASDVSPRLAAVSSAALALDGLLVAVGVRLVRGRRRLVLFLRRFGYRDATTALTSSAVGTLGRSWRVVTLDDAAIAPVGVASEIRQVVGAGEYAVKALPRWWGASLRVLWWMFLAGAAAVAGLAAVFILRGESLSGQAEGGGVLAALIELVTAVALAGVAVAAVGLLLQAAVLLFVLLPVTSVAGAVRRAERGRRYSISSPREIDAVARSVVRRARRVFSPRLMVVTVSPELWQGAVRRFAASASTLLIDVSEPSENLLWEIQEMTREPGARCVFVGRHDRVLGMTGRLASLLDGRSVLAYTTDEPGIRRFSRSLLGRFEALAG